MSAIDFPALPVLNQDFTAPSGVSYRWNGVLWRSVGADVPGPTSPEVPIAGNIIRDISVSVAGPSIAMFDLNMKHIRIDFSVTPLVDGAYLLFNYAIGASVQNADGAYAMQFGATGGPYLDENGGEAVAGYELTRTAVEIADAVAAGLPAISTPGCAGKIETALGRVRAAGEWTSYYRSNDGWNYRYSGTFYGPTGTTVNGAILTWDSGNFAIGSWVRVFGWE